MKTPVQKAHEAAKLMAAIVGSMPAPGATESRIKAVLTRLDAAQDQLYEAMDEYMRLAKEKAP